MCISVIVNNKNARKNFRTGRVRGSRNDRTDAGNPDSGKAAETAVSTASPIHAGANGIYVRNGIVGRISSRHEALHERIVAIIFILAPVEIFSIKNTKYALKRA